MEKEIISAIYQIFNKNNGKIYIGSAENLYKRWSEHKRGARRNRHTNKYFQNAWNKHGEEAFEFSILEIVKDINNIFEREQFYLNKLKPWNRKIGYNIHKDAKGPRGVKRTKETKKKLSECKMGPKNPMYQRDFSIEHRKKISEANSKEKHWLWGRHVRDDVKSKISDKLTGYEQTEEHKKNTSRGSFEGWKKRTKRMYSVFVNGIIYKSVRQAEKVTGISRDFIKNECNKKTNPNIRYEES